MSKIWIAAFAIFFVLKGFSAEQELTLKLKPDGQPSFGIQYAYDQDLAWIFTYATTISNQMLSSLPNVMWWNVVNTKDNTVIAEWKEIDKAMLTVGSLGISTKPAIRALLPNLKTAKVVYGIKKPNGDIETLFFIPIGSFCQNYADHFVDLTAMKKGCDVKAEDIPDQCRDLESKLLTLVNRGLTTCAAAKKMYEKNECGALTCP